MRCDAAMGDITLLLQRAFLDNPATCDLYFLGSCHNDYTRQAWGRKCRIDPTMKKFPCVDNFDCRSPWGSGCLPVIAAATTFTTASHPAPSSSFCRSDKSRVMMGGGPNRWMDGWIGLRRKGKVFSFLPSSIPGICALSFLDSEAMPLMVAVTVVVTVADEIRLCSYTRHHRNS